MRAQGGWKRKALPPSTRRATCSSSACCCSLRGRVGGTCRQGCSVRNSYVARPTQLRGGLLARCNLAALHGLARWRHVTAALATPRPTHLSLRRPAVPKRKTGVRAHWRRGTTAAAHSSRGPAHRQERRQAGRQVIEGGLEIGKPTGGECRRWQVPRRSARGQAAMPTALAPPLPPHPPPPSAPAAPRARSSSPASSPRNRSSPGSVSTRW